jgi:hypothetical protein
MEERGEYGNQKKKKFEIDELINWLQQIKDRNDPEGKVMVEFIQMIEYLKELKTHRKLRERKIICFCGSLRFKKYFEEYEFKTALEGNIALLPCCMHVDIERKFGNGEYKQMVDKIHLSKIDLADEVFVINKNGYIGESTRKEIEYAQSQHKIIVYLEVLYA